MSSLLADKNFRIGALIAGAVTTALLIFCLGIFVGARGLRPFDGSRFFTAFRIHRGHGAVGTVSNVQGNKITMMDIVSETVTIDVLQSTRIELAPQGRAELQDIHIGDRLVVIGSPDNGIIEARFIRVVRKPD